MIVCSTYENCILLLIVHTALQQFQSYVIYIEHKKYLEEHPCNKFFSRSKSHIIQEKISEPPKLGTVLSACELFL